VLIVQNRLKSKGARGGGNVCPIFFHLRIFLGGGGGSCFKKGKKR